MKVLGGIRHERPDSINMGWRNASFRGYADYMQTEEFARAVGGLLQLCCGKRCAVMCAEAVPWRCHRSLLADALAARGIPVEHILSGCRRDLHNITPFARIENEKVTYPESEAEVRSKKSAAGQAELRFDESEAAAMPSKKRKTKFTAAKEARRRARLVAGSPPVERVIADKRRKPAKHKKTLKDIAEI